MASFAARRSPSALWMIKECAHFAALKEFELLQLLAPGTNKKAFATARRLSLYSSTPPNRSRNRPAVQPLPVTGMPHLRNLLLLQRQGPRRQYLASDAVPRAARAPSRTAGIHPPTPAQTRSHCG